MVCLRTQIHPLTRLLLVVASVVALFSVAAPSRSIQAAPLPTSGALMQRAAPAANAALQTCYLSYANGCVTPGGPAVTLGHTYAVCGTYCGPIRIEWSTSSLPSWLSVVLTPTTTYTYSAWVWVVVQAAASAPVGTIGTFSTYCEAYTPDGGSVGCANAIQWSVQVVCKPTRTVCVKLKIIDVEPGSPTYGQDLSYTGRTIHMVVGQHIQLLVVASNGHAVSNIQWSIPITTPTAIAPIAIKQYALPNPTAPYTATTPPPSLHPRPLLPSDVQGRTVAFYWVQQNDNYVWGSPLPPSPTPYWVSVSGTVDGQPAGATAQYTVAEPNVEVDGGLLSNQATMYSQTGQVGIGCCFAGHQYLSLGYNATAVATPGISFTDFTALAPPNGQGEIGATQLISRTATFSTITHTVTLASTGSQYWLDTCALYPRPPVTTTLANTPPFVPLIAGGSASWSSLDNPLVPLVQPGTYSDTAAFQIYLLYRPDGTDSIWVPLGVLSWGYGGTATYNKGVWTLSSASNPNPPNPGGVPTATFPAWDHVYNPRALGYC